jgi:glutamyl endopeptidase
MTSTQTKGFVSEPNEGKDILLSKDKDVQELSPSQRKKQPEVSDNDRPIARVDDCERQLQNRQKTKGELEIEPVPRNRPESVASLAKPLLECDFLDSWHANYSKDFSVAQLMDGRKVSESILETILPSGDDRIQIENTQSNPWRWICSLIITAADGSQWVGSGWLASPRTVITAGHCVFIHGHGGWAQRIDVFPARNADWAPYKLSSIDLHSVEGWTIKRNSENDYGAILLPESVEDLGFFGYQSMEEGDLSGLTVNVYGYPADKQPGTLWGHGRTLERVMPRTIIYDISTFGGQSGCPVFFKDQQRRYVVGIHNYGDFSGNSATRITDEVFDNIKYWTTQGELDSKSWNT